MKIKTTIAILICTFLLSSCVSQKKFDSLKQDFNKLSIEKSNCDSLNLLTLAKSKELQKEIEKLNNDLNKSKFELEEKKAEYEQSKKLYDQLKEIYETKLANEALTKDELKKSLRELEDKLVKKELELNEKEANLLKKEQEVKKLSDDLNKIANNLKERENRIKELEDLIKQKDEKVKNLKESLENELLGYKESGLSVSIKNGKVYVSVEEKLLFQSGKTDVSANGKKALLKVCQSIKNVKDFEIMVEGHTDDVPIKTARYEDNWDLSVLRATSVIRIMIKEGEIDPKSVIPTGRGKYYPADMGDTAESKAKNRRIEIILSPDIEKILNIIKN
ncbi:MAG: OmpA family protein [Bacteroidetes bacterium]|nr:OmpA family protein [Bacteroidota bacterium]